MRVVVADDSLLVRQGVVHILTDAGLEVVGEAQDADQAAQVASSRQPDAVVLDIRMPPTFTDEGIVAAQRIRSSWPDVCVLVLSEYVDPQYAMQLISERPEGVGYLLKERVFDGAVLVDALRRLEAGQTVVDPAIVSRLLARPRRRDPVQTLSQREREVLQLVAEGLSNRSISTRLSVTERTVEAHIRQIFLKLGLDDDPSSHRRVLAVLAYLRSDAGAPGTSL